MATITGGGQSSYVLAQTPSTGFFNGQALSVQAIIRQNMGTSGTNADQYDLIHAATYSFTASNAQTINLQSLTDPYGSAVNFARFNLIHVKNKSTNASATLTITGGGTNGNVAFVNGTLIIGAATNSNESGFIAVSPNSTGWAVAANTRQLVLTPSAHAFDVDVVIAGRSA